MSDRKEDLRPKVLFSWLPDPGIAPLVSMHKVYACMQNARGGFWCATTGGGRPSTTLPFAGARLLMRAVKMSQNKSLTQA